MNSFKEFLEFSTIHGLVHIASNKNFARVFWVVVVMIGFTMAIMLINDSLTNWSDYPIKTTIETKPIMALTFPKVTVCPPDNIFTELNYDLMMIDDFELTIDSKEQILDIVLNELDPEKFTFNVPDENLFDIEEELALVENAQMNGIDSSSTSNQNKFIRFLNIISSESFNQQEVDVIIKKSRFLNIFDACVSCNTSDEFSIETKRILSSIEEKFDLETNYIVKSHYTEEVYSTTIAYMETILTNCNYCPSSEIGPALELLKNTIFGIEIKEELIKRAVTDLHDAYFGDLKTNISKIEETNRYYNWYHGYNWIEFPYWIESIGLNYFIYTSATSGRIRTKNFDFYDDFKTLKANFEEHLFYMIDIGTPWEIASNPDINLIMEVRKVSTRSSGGNSDEYLDFQWNSLNDEDDFDCENSKDEIPFNFTGPDHYHSLLLERNIKKKALKESECMPGFQIDWHYNLDDIRPDADNAYNCDNEAFRRLVNIFHNNFNFQQKIVEMIKDMKIEFTLKFFDEYLYCEDIKKLIISLESKTGIEGNSDFLTDISDETFDIAAEIFIYLKSMPPKSQIDKVKGKIEKSIKMLSPKMLLIMLNRLLIANGKDLAFKEEIGNIFLKIRNLWNPSHEQLALSLGTSTSNESFNGTLLENEESKEMEMTESDIDEFSEILNSPIHIFNAKGDMMPSALVPFCWFGKKQKIGELHEMFNVSVCNNFKAKIRNDKICYEIDPNIFIKSGNKLKDLELGIYFVLDENLDRRNIHGLDVEEYDGNQEIFLDSSSSKSLIYLDTIDSLELTPGWKYNLNAIKKIRVSKDFLGLSEATKNCADEPYDDCTTRSYSKRLLDSCDCLPLNLRTLENRKFPLCDSSQLQCVENVTVLDETCLRGCEGLYVTSYEKSPVDPSSFKLFWKRALEDYMKYKHQADITFPDELKDYAWNDSYKITGIYIETPVFDEVMRDVSAKNVDKLAIVGGTFGLLTGCSLISGVEILFFVTKFLTNFFGKRRETKETNKNIY